MVKWYIEDENGNAKGSIKLDRAEKLYNGFKGEMALRRIMSQIPMELVEQLTSKQLALVTEALDKAYHDGKNDRYDG